MDQVWLNMINLLGSLGLFIYGLKVMSDGIQRAAGETLRGFLNKVTSSRLLALFTGFLLTSLVQSSSASTVLTVGLVNAGLLNAYQSLGVIFGINIGTTVTGWIISILGIQLSSYKTLLPLLIFATPLLFAKRKSLNAWADFFMGFFLLLIGLFFMRDNVPDFSQLHYDFGYLYGLAQYSMLSTVLFVFLGIIITILLQSSTATMALTIVLCNKGWLPFEVSTAMILGSNIGTTSTAEIAALIGNPQARVTARMHTLFNVFGSIWAILLMPLLLKWSDMIGLWLFYDTSAFDAESSVPYALAIFHTSFNTFNVVLFLSFPKLIHFAAVKTVKGANLKPQDDFSSPLRDNLNMPDLTLLAIQKEIMRYIGLNKKMNPLLSSLVNEVEDLAKENAFLIIKKNEGKIDDQEKLIKKYLTNAMTEEISDRAAQKITSLLSVTKELERIGDLYTDMAKLIYHKKDQQIWLSTQQRSQINSIIYLIDRGHNQILELFTSTSTKALHLTEISVLHTELQSLQKVVENSMEEHDIHKASPKLMFALLQTADNISDHLYSIAREIDGMNS